MSTIAAGTEIGHERVEKSHAEGYRVRIALTLCHANYVNANFKSIERKFNGAPQYLDTKTSNVFALGGNHYESRFAIHNIN